MYALINTMGKIQNDSIGTVLSFHHTVEAAEKASDKTQRQVKRANGDNSYLPTIIVEIRGKYRLGEHVSPCDATGVGEEEY